jgi:hypothetical protein
LPINDPRLVKLTQIQKAYTLFNIFRIQTAKEEMDFNKLKLILAFIDPQKAKMLEEVETVENVNFIKELQEKLPNENVEELIESLENDYDVISKV